ncbi:hypothetical protein ACFY19_20595 [Streptosporangium saharense]|uniref:hypothetical protein n=1 Tax=Streptosporangium saharense TaxID=1706840 RepID=UPI0036749307
MTAERLTEGEGRPDETAAEIPCSTSCPPDREVTEKTAIKYGQAIDAVRRGLRSAGIRTSRPVHKVAVRLDGAGPYPKARCTWFIPHLTTYNEHSPFATVTVGRRTLNYLVSIPSMGIESQMVEKGHVEAVVDLVLTAHAHADGMAPTPQGAS